MTSKFSTPVRGGVPHAMPCAIQNAMSQAACQTGDRAPVRDDASRECSQLHGVRNDIFFNSDNNIKPWISDLSAPDDIDGIRVADVTKSIAWETGKLWASDERQPSPAMATGILPGIAAAVILVRDGNCRQCVLPGIRMPKSFDERSPHKTRTKQKREKANWD